MVVVTRLVVGVGVVYGYIKGGREIKMWWTGLKNFKKTTSIWWPPRPFEDPSSIVFMPDET